MTTAYTSLLGLALPVTGELSGTWGDTVNNSITSLVDTAVAGTTNVSADSNVTLTTTTGASNQARQAILLFSGARTAIRTVTAPAQSKIYTVINATTGGFAVQLVGAGPTTGVTIANGARTVVAWNGSDFVEVSSPSSIILPGGTANGVLYLNGSKVVTSGSALTFDGTNLGVGTASPSRFIDFEKNQNAGTLTRIGNTTSGTGAYAALQLSSSGTTYLYNFSAGYTTSGIFAASTSLLDSGANNLNFNSAGNAWYLGGSEQMRLTSTGLGIGTSSPAEKLHVNSGTGNVPALFESTDPIAVVQFKDNNSTLFNAVGVQTNSLIFYSADNINMRLDNSGNLGLGVTPSAWFTGGGYKVMQIGPAMAFDAGTDFRARISANGFVNSSGDWRYINTGFASNYTQVSGQHQFFTAPSGTAGNAITFTQAMTLDASGNLALGKTSTSYRLGMQVASSGTNVSALEITNATNASFEVFIKTDTTTVNAGGAGNLVFATGGSVTERARITSSGNLLVGGTNSDPITANAVGIALESQGSGKFSRSANPGLDVNRITNDGELVRFYQDGTQEGNISVSGTTVSYNGGHLSRCAQTIAAKDDTLVKGTVLSNLDEMSVYIKDGQPVANEQLNKVKVSDIEGDVNVAGVFVNWTHDEQHSVDEINMAMTGDMIIRIAQGVTVVRGDLLMSAGNGTAKPQGDDIVRSKTIAKVTSNHVTCTYADGSYCVPCVLMAC